MSDLNTKDIYDKVYRVSGLNYGNVGEDVSSRVNPQLEFVAGQLRSLGVGPNASVLEVGCGLAHLHTCHPNWRGVEYSTTAIAQARERFGPDLPIVEGDATNLQIASGSVDFYFSFAALEHVPRIDRAFAEIERVLKNGGFAVLWPAWNCRSWTVKKLQQRPYGELSFSERLQKLLIPIRENLVFRLVASLPGRVRRELALASGRKLDLEYARLEPDQSLWDRYPHIADDDAFVSIDAHAAIAYFVSRGWQVRSHPTFARRFACRGEAIVLQKTQ
jgi:SAM-dependent methyltransferase